MAKSRSSSRLGLSGLKFSKDPEGKSRIVNTETIRALRIDDETHFSVAPRSGAATSVHIPTTMGGKRRIHAEGLQMLENHYNTTEEKMKLQSMENRIRRLEFEDERARKMEELAHKRADNMIEARKRHFEDLMLKKNFYLNKQLAENKQRELNLKKKSDTQQNIQMRRFEAMSQAIDIKLKVKQDISQVRVQEQAIRIKQMEKQQERKLRDLVQKNNSRKQHDSHVAQRKFNAGSAYSLRHQKEAMDQSAYRSRIDRLGEQEMRLVEKLQQTTNRQRSAYMELENVVQEGYDYYFQSFSEKQQIQQKRGSNSSVQNPATSRYQSVDLPTAKSVETLASLDHSGLAPEGSKLRQLQSNKELLTDEGQLPYMDNQMVKIVANGKKSLNVSQDLTNERIVRLKAQMNMELIMGRKPNRKRTKR